MRIFAPTVAAMTLFSGVALFSGCSGGSQSVFAPNQRASLGTQSMSSAQSLTSLNSTAIYINSTPGPNGHYPIAVQATSTPAEMTIEAVVKCKTTSAGSAVVSFNTSWSFEAGVCDGKTNPQGSSGSHLYSTASNKQAGPTPPSVGLSSGLTYYIAGSKDINALNFYVCKYPNGICSKYSSKDTSALSYSSSVLNIGAASDGKRIFLGDVWSVALYNSALSATTIQTHANAAIVDPYPSPTPTQVLDVRCIPSGSQLYPVTSACFTGNTVFHHTVVALKGAGATIDASAESAQFWGQGVVYTGPSQNAYPLYYANSNAIAYSLICNGYGGSACTKGNHIYFPSGASQPATGGDAHFSSIDVTRSNEIDTWVCPQQPNGSSVTCNSAANLPFGGNAGGGSPGGVGAGYAIGAMQISAQDLINYATHGVHIGHALGFNTKCLNTPNSPRILYPAVRNGSDSLCANGSNAPAYGNLIHLKSSINVTLLTSDKTCQAVLFALQDYGGYTFDTGYGIMNDWEGYRSYTHLPFTSNPWTNGTINMTVADNNGQCLDFVNASNSEILTINQAGDSALPAKHAYWNSTGTPTQ